MKIYRRTFKRSVKNGAIFYAGMEYTSPELKSLPNNTKVNVTKFGDEPGSFDISKLLIDAIPTLNIKNNFWVK